MSQNNWITKYIKLEDAESIESSVLKAEADADAEFVVAVAKSCSGFGHVFPLIWLVLGVIGTLLLREFGENGVLSEFFFPNAEFDWSETGPAIYEVLVLIGTGILSLLLSQRSWVRRVLTHDADEQLAVHRVAEIEFYRRHIEREAGGSGVLIFISMVERKAVILVGSRIQKIISSDTLNEIMKKELLSKTARGEYRSAIEATVARLAELISKTRKRAPGTANLISNKIIVIG
jgi:putative membrane protein